MAGSRHTFSRVPHSTRFFTVEGFQLNVQPRRKVAPRRAFGILAAATTAVALTLAGGTAASATDRVSYSGSVPRWATAVNDAGAAAPDTSIEGEIFLPLRDQAGAEYYATSISTPGSPNYRKVFTPAQWIAKFSPSQTSVDAVVSTLTYLGLKVSGIPQSRQYVVFRGTAAQFGAAFGTSIHKYRYSGQLLAAPTSAPSLPASVAKFVSGIALDQSRLLTHPDSIRQQDVTPPSTVRSLGTSAATSSPAVCSSYAGEHTFTAPLAYGATKFDTFACGYTPSQLRSAYGLNSLSKKGVNGAGQTVAIIDAYASPSIIQDVNTYSAQVGEPGLTAATYSQLIPKTSEYVDQAICQFPSGWQGEQTLDVESVHGIAPGAKILYVGGINCAGGLDLAMSKILDGKLANIVSNSYGNQGEAVPTAVLVGQTNLHLQAAAEGIGLYFSSGDSGDEFNNLGYTSPDFPASSPWVTAVGGTSMGVDKTGKIAYVTGWGTASDQILANGSGYATPLPGAFRSGAGGGTSAFFAQPAYQRGVVPNSLAKGHRVSPDIASLADPYTGFSIGIRPIVDDTTLATGAFTRETYGGTSLASPIAAAQMAIVQQASNSVVGFANPTLYAVNRAEPGAFRDVLSLTPPKALAYTSAVSGNSFLITLGQDSSLTTARGYDNVTGMGELTFGGFADVAAVKH